MRSVYKQVGWISGDCLGDIDYKVALKAGDNYIETIESHPPTPVYNDNADILGYEGGIIKAVIHIAGTKLPTARQFSDMFHEFIHRENIMWTSELEQDMLWEIAHATEI